MTLFTLEQINNVLSAYMYIYMIIIQSAKANSRDKHKMRKYALTGIGLPGFQISQYCQRCIANNCLQRKGQSTSQFSFGVYNPSVGRFLYGRSRLIEGICEINRRPQHCTLSSACHIDVGLILFACHNVSVLHLHSNIT